MLEIVRPMTAPDTDSVPRLVTLQDAAEILGVSVRTIRRRVRSGELVSVMSDGRRLVSLPDVPQDPTDNASSADTVSPPDSDVSRPPSPLVLQLEARIVELEGDRDRARQDADSWQAMSQDLSQRLSEVTATLYKLTEA